MAFPDDPQSVYVDLPQDLLAGDFFEGDQLNEINLRGFIPERTKVSQVTTGTVVPNNGDDVGVFIDGALVFVVSTADANATALLLETAIEGTAALAGIISDVVVAGADFTINFSDFLAHTVTAYSPATADVTPIVEDTAAVDQVKLQFGDAVVVDTSVVTGSGTPIRAMESVSDTLYGIIGRMPGCQITEEMLRLQGYSIDHLQPARGYSVTSEKMGIVVPYFGTAPNAGDPVYAKPGVNGTATTYGIDDGGVSEIATYTVTTSVSDAIAFNVDGYPTLTTPATNVAIDDATSLVALWNASPFYSVLGTVVDNLDGTFTVTYADSSVHLFTDESTGANAVGEVIDTAAVAASAKLLPNSSWAGPSNTSLTLAYLRVDVRAN